MLKRDVKGAVSGLLNRAAEIVPSLEVTLRELYATTLSPFRSFRNEQLAIVAMSRLLGASSNCIDVGAHNGSILHHMMRFAPGGTFFAIEPLPYQFSKLQACYKDDRNVHLFNMALSNINERRVFHHSIDEPGTSSFRINPQTQSGPAIPIEVEVKKLDDIIDAKQAIDFIKIDVEGAELEVLQGALATIEKNAPAILFEHHRIGAQPYGHTSTPLFELLVSTLGYKIYTVDDWCHDRRPLLLATFKAEFDLGKNLDFIAIRSK